MSVDLRARAFLAELARLELKWGLRIEGCGDSWCPWVSTDSGEIVVEHFDDELSRVREEVASEMRSERG